MLKLIKFEFRKIFRSKYMYIIFGIGLALTLLAVPMVNLVNMMAEMTGEPTIPYSGYYAGKSALTSMFALMTGIFIGIFACEDFSKGTNRNIIAKGYHRLSLFYSKYLVSLILCIGYALITVLLSLGLGYAIYGNGGMTIDDNVFVIFICQLVCVIGYHAFFFAVSYSLGRTAPAIAINIVVPSALELIITIIDILIKSDEFLLSNFVIDGALANLSATYTNTSIILPSMLVIVGYIALSNGLGILVASKKQF